MNGPPATTGAGAVTRWSPDCSRRAALAVVLLALALGIQLRVGDYPSLFLYGDEVHTLELSRRSYAHILSSYEPRGSGIALPLLQRVTLDLFGPGLWAFRLPVLIAGIAALALMYPVARRLAGVPAAAIATLALGTSSFHVYYSHFARAYVLAIPFALLLVWALHRALAEDAKSRRGYGVAAVSAGLLPYLHLTSLGLVAAAGVAAALVVLVTRRPRRELFWLVGSFAAAAALCALLHLSAGDAFWGFLGHRLERRPASLSFGVVAVATRFAGSPGFAWVWLLALPLASVWMLRVRGAIALLPVCAALLPIAILVATRPVGGVHAYARYLLPSLPFALILLSWAIAELVRRAIRLPQRADLAALGVGIVLVGLAWWLGPLGWQQPNDGPYGNMAHRLYARPDRSDAPRPGTPAFYARLAASDGPVRIVEAPSFKNYYLNLYRSYYLQHRKGTWLGSLGPSTFDRISGPYVVVYAPRRLLRSGADYLILHRDVERELRGASGRRVDDPVEPVPELFIERLRRALGRAVYEDHDILVWKLRAEAP